MNIIEARSDPNLFGRLRRDPATWRAWDTILKAAFALPMDPSERRLFTKLAKRKPPKRLVRELWVIAGRRGGKTSTAAEVACYLAAFQDFRPSLRPGERAVIPILAVDRAQARVAHGYVRSTFRSIPMLAALVERENRESLDLSNGATIEVFTNNFVRVRGRTIAAAIFDECAFWKNETSVTPDVETYNALMPGMATVEGALLIGISSPYRRAGLLYQKYANHFGKDGDVLVIRAPSRQLNPTLPAKVVRDALKADPAAARSEWLAEFRDDISGFLDAETVVDAVERGMKRQAPQPGITYRAFADPAGTGRDEFTLAIGHLESDGKTRVIDLCLARQGKPHGIVAEYAGVLKQYGLHAVVGDKYAAGWVTDAFKEAGIVYRYADKTRSEIYLETLPHFVTGQVRVPDDKRLIAQLQGLERRTSRTGRDIVDHGPNGHDDRANACCGVIDLCAAPVQIRRTLHMRIA